MIQTDRRTLWIVAVLVAAGCSVAGAAENDTPGDDAIEITGFTIPFRELAIASEIGGVLTEVKVDEGERVKKEQVLVQLRDDILRAQLDISKANVVAAEHEIEAAQATYETEKLEYDRIAKLFNDGTVSTEEHGVAKLEMRIAKIRYENALHTKKIYELTVIRDEEGVRRTQIRSPCDGLVHRILKREGEAIEQEREPVLDLACIDPLFVIAHVPISTTGRIKVGDQAQVKLEHVADKQLACEVAVVDKVGDAASGTYRVKLMLPNPGGRLPSGTRGTVTFKLSDATKK